jgi:hypothetical protein
VKVLSSVPFLSSLLFTYTSNKYKRHCSRNNQDPFTPIGDKFTLEHRDMNGHCQKCKKNAVIVFEYKRVKFIKFWMIVIRH